MKIRKIFLLVLLAILALQPACFYVEYVKSNLGLSPEKEEYEAFASAKISALEIEYEYSPPNFTKQRIRFEVDRPEIIEKLQKSLKIKEVSPYTLGVYPFVYFYFAGDQNNFEEWRISFATEKEIRFAHNAKRFQRSCVCYLVDDSFYIAIKNLAYENNKKLFPDSTINEINL